MLELHDKFEKSKTNDSWLDQVYDYLPLSKDITCQQVLESVGKDVDGLEISSSFFEKYSIGDSDEIIVTT